MDRKPFVVKMDVRESGSNVGEILRQQYGINVLVEQLKTGDYIINREIVVERKTTSDFINSMIDGRIFTQARKMKHSYNVCAFIVEGDDLHSGSFGVHPHAIKGALVSISMMWGIPVIFSKDFKDTALFLWLIGSQNLNVGNEVSYRFGRHPKRLQRKQLYILQGLPQIGPKLAVQLLNHFGSVEKVITASSDELMQVHGVGQKKADKVKAVVTAI